MDDEQGGAWTRRDMLGGLALFGLVVGVPAAAVHLSRLDPGLAPTDAQRVLLRHVSQLVIPRTDTPGAGDVGTGDFVAFALAHGLEGARKPLEAAKPYAVFLRPDGSLDHVAWLEKALGQKDRNAALKALDADAYADGVRDHPWRTIKGLILTGYYTSEAGGSQELQFELVPGRFDPDVPLKPGDRAFSSDWTAVDFG